MSKVKDQNFLESQIESIQEENNANQSQDGQKLNRSNIKIKLKNQSSKQPQLRNHSFTSNKYLTEKGNFNEVTSIFADVDDYMMMKTQDILQKRKSTQIPNFCSTIYKKHKREFEHQNKKGYMSLVSKIKESSQMVNNVKTGKSLFESQEVQQYHIPILKSQDLRQNLQDLISKSQEEISVNASQENLALIQCLSPKKFQKTNFNTKKSIDLSKIQEGADGQDFMRQPYQVDQKSQLISRQQSFGLPVIMPRKSSLGSNNNGQNMLILKELDLGRENSRNIEQTNTSFTDLPYQSKVKELNILKKSFDFPNNPAYLSRSKNKKKLKFITDYCHENQVAMSNNEEVIMNLDMSRLKHKIWRKEVTQLFDGQNNPKDEVDELIDNFKNFDKLKFTKFEIQNFLTRCNERQRNIEDNKKQQNKKLIKRIPDLLEDDLSIINQVKKLKQQRDLAKRKDSVVTVKESSITQNILRYLPSQVKRNMNNSQLKPQSQGLLSENSSKYGTNMHNSTIKMKAVVAQAVQQSRKPSNDLDKSPRNSFSSTSFVSKVNTTGQLNKALTFNQKGTNQLNDALMKIQNQRKAHEEERVKEQLRLDRKRQEKLRLLQKQLEDPQLLRQHKLRDKKRNKGPRIESTNLTEPPEIAGFTDSDDDKSKRTVERDILKDKTIQRKPIIKLVNATANINKGKQRINRQLMKLIERLDLDRPLMLKEKLDIIWKGKNPNQSVDEITNFNASFDLSQMTMSQNDSQTFITNDPSSPIKITNQEQLSKISLKNSEERENIETLNLRVELDKKKQNRNHLNNKQRECYNRMLMYLERRKKPIQNEEKKFMNIIKIVIDGGWIIREEDFIQILELVNFGQVQEERLEMNQDIQNTGNILEGLDHKNSIQKEIAKDIILHKVHKPVMNSIDGTELKYMFIIENKALKEIEFIADFTGSDNFFLEQSGANPNQNMQSVNSSKQEKQAAYVVKKEIGPLQTELVARVRLMKNWKLKTKFRFTLKNPPIESQKQYLKKHLVEHKVKLDYAKKTYPIVPFSLMAIEAAEQRLHELKVSQFVDLEFEPSDSSVFDNQIDSPFDVIIHWRRPQEFLKADFQEGLLDPNVFYDTIEPNDIKPGVLGNEWFLSAVSILAERPALIERLFITKEISKNGIYRVRLCKNGEWITVTIDDFFPCYPEGEPIFAKCHANEMWVMILEKAYAKLHGNYYLLRGGFVNEALIDLTGCPSISYDLDDEYVQHFIENGQFWDLIRHFDDEGYLLSFSTPGEGRWVDNSQSQQPAHNGQNDAEQNNLQEIINSLPKGQAFTIVLVKDVYGNQLFNLRSPLQNFDWRGDWSEKSGKWTQKIRDAVGPVFLQNSEEGDGTFWMSYQDAIKFFKSLNVCRVKNWEEVRIKGKFIRVQDIEDPYMEAVISKWYYSIDLHETTKIFIGLHQEDERIKGVIARRPFLDIGLAILKRTNDGLELVDLKDFAQDRQCEIEVNLEAGSYIILPRTTGCTLKRPESAQAQNFQLINLNGQLHEMLELTLDDIFRKFDMLLNQELTFCEFKGFCECIGRSNLTEKEFQSEILGKYHSTQRGISLKGFKEFFKHQVIEIKQNFNGNDEQVWQWLENLGYDRDLYSIRSRVFILSMHSATEVSVTVRDAVQTDLDQRTNLLVIDKFGQELENKKGYKLLYTFSEQVHAYSYAVQNIFGKTVDITLDCSNSQNMLFSSKGNRITKRIEAGHTEFMMHSMAMPNVSKFVRSAKSKTAHMSYNCIPVWQQPTKTDPFDYKLRSKAEVQHEFKYMPAAFDITTAYKGYSAGDTTVNSNDTRERVAKIWIDLRDLQLGPLQRQRFVYLLGPRYQNSHKVKIVCKQYNTFIENFVRANETLRELYWESKRAPETNVTAIRNPYRREFLFKKFFGRTKEERKATLAMVKQAQIQNIRDVDAKEAGLKVEENVKNESLRQKRRQIAAKRLSLGFNDKGKDEIDDQVIDDLEYKVREHLKMQAEKLERKPVKLVTEVKNISKEEYMSQMLREEERFRTV